jgi:L-aminopeptidase/D-esterase-like protein
MICPGPRNALTDVPGILVGNAASERVRTGVTVVLAEKPMVAACDVRGGGPGTRETDLLSSDGAVIAIDAVVLSGGSALGLDAAGAVANWLAARGRGYRVGSAVVPLVPAAILFDLLNGGDKGWGETPPYRDLARAAIESAAQDFALGNAGAGMGAKAGRLKGGLGTASLVDDARFVVGALAAANPMGSVVMPGTASFWAWPFERNGELGGQPMPSFAGDMPLEHDFARATVAANTTLCVVAVNAALDRAQARRLAIMAQDGIARAVRPVHTPFDGDSVFVLAAGPKPLDNPASDLARLGMMAADCVARAIARGVYMAESVPGWPSYRSVHGDSLLGKGRLA